MVIIWGCRTLLNEHVRVMGRKKSYESIKEMHKDLDAYLITYNTKRLHQGRGIHGRTSADTFQRCLLKPKKQEEEKTKKAA